MRILPLLLASALALTIIPTPAESQLRWGIHVAHAGKSFGGTTGLGARVGFDLPVIPLGFYASAESFFPSCPGEDTCRLRGATLDAHYRFPFPVIQPYATAGMAYRHFLPGDGSASEDVTGVVAGVGTTVSAGVVRGFAEARYEFAQVPSSQVMLRFGVLFGVF